MSKLGSPAIIVQEKGQTKQEMGGGTVVGQVHPGGGLLDAFDNLS